MTTDYLLKEEQGEPEYTAEDDTPALRKVTLAQANDCLAKAQANAPKMALATALCIVSPVPLIFLGALSTHSLFPLSEGASAGLGLTILLVLIAVAVVLFMQCGAAVKPYEFLEKEPIDTEYGVTGLVQERRDAFAARYNSANTLGTVLCILAAVPLFAAMMLTDTEVLSASAVCLLLVLVACGVYAFVRWVPSRMPWINCWKQATLPATPKPARGSSARYRRRTGWWSWPSSCSTPSAPMATASRSTAGHLGHCRRGICRRDGGDESRPAQKAINLFTFSKNCAYNKAIL